MAMASADMTREELDARFGVVEARTDAKFERVLAEFRESQSTLRAEFRESRAEFRESTAELRASDTELRAEIRAGYAELSAKIDALAARTVDKMTAAVLLAAAIALVFSMIAFGGDQFGAGREVGVAIAALEAKIDRLAREAPTTPIRPPAPR